MWPIGLEDVDFREAVDWFLARTPITRAEWDALTVAARKKAFMVSGVAQLDVVHDVWRALDRALADGRSFKEFQAEIGERLRAAWAGSVDRPATRLETIFRTNLQGAYSAGRYAQLTSPDVLEDRPVWLYNAILDGRVTETCRACDGTVLPADHPFWKSHQPPLHFNCRSCIVALTEEQARAHGITPRAPTVEADEGFGAPPGEDDWSPDPAKYPPELWKLLTEKELPAPIALPAPTPAENILHERIDGPKGSNDGGVYVGHDGIKRYVKFYRDEAQAYGEHLANSIYRDLGLAAPESIVFEHEGRAAYASVIVEGAETLGRAGLTAERAKEVMRGFVADVLTANWDAVGTGKDNILVLPSGALMRVDQGGSFLMRAQAGRKPLDALGNISEWQKLRDPSVNRDYHDVAKAAGMTGEARLKATAVRGIRNVLALRDRVGGWTSYVERVAGGLGADDKQAIVQMLETRTGLLEEKLRALTARRPRKVATPEGQVLFDADSALGRRLLTKLDELQERAKREPLYGRIFAEAGIGDDDFAATRTDIGRWVGETRLGTAHLRLYRAYARVCGGAVDADEETVERLRKIQPTRRKRWEMFLREMGEQGPAPTHIRAYRGVGGKEWVLDVARAWADEKTDLVTVRSHELASWSILQKVGRQFADDQDSSHNVVFRWDVPIEHTTHDQVADDAGFLSEFPNEREVIAGLGHENGVPVPKKDVVVTFEGVKYTYATREALLGKMRERGLLHRPRATPGPDGAS